MMFRGLLRLCVLVPWVLASCGEEKIEVHQGESADYNHGALLSAVDKFVANGRTPLAYAELSQTSFELRSGMDRTVAKEAELKLMVLALASIEAASAAVATESARAAPEEEAGRT